MSSSIGLTDWLIMSHLCTKQHTQDTLTYRDKNKFQSSHVHKNAVDLGLLLSRLRFHWINILQYWGWISVIVTATAGIANGWCERILAWVRRCCLRLVDWANRRLHPSNGHTYGLSPVWMRTWVRRLKSNEKRLPHPSNGHWKAFSPVCTSWWRRSFELSTNDFWHSWQTWTPTKKIRNSEWNLFSRRFTHVAHGYVNVCSSRLYLETSLYNLTVDNESFSVGRQTASVPVVFDVV